MKKSEFCRYASHPNLFEPKDNDVREQLLKLRMNSLSYVRNQATCGDVEQGPHDLIFLEKNHL